MIRRWWTWLRLFGAAGILVVLAWRLGTGAFLDGLRAISFWSLLAALGIGVGTTVCCAWRWCVITRGLGLQLALRTAVADYYRSVLLNSVLPAGVLGDVHRGVSHGHRSGKLGRGVRAVVLERFAGQVVLIAIGVIACLVHPALSRDIVSASAVITASVVLIGLAGVVTFLGLRVLAVRRAAATFWRDTRIALLSRSALPPVVISSAAAVAGHVSLFLVAAKVAGSEVPTGALLPLLVLALLVMALPINIGGWGPREAFLAVAFSATGLNPAQGLAMSVVYGVLAMVTALPGVFFLFRRDSAQNRQMVPESADQPGQQLATLAR